MNILITGDRNWSSGHQLEQVVRVFEDLLIPAHGRGITIIHGDARGVDTMADIVAKALYLKVIRCPAHWQHDEERWVKAYGPCPDSCKEIVGRPAGALRNRYMMKTHHPKLVVAFHNSLHTSRGTKDMVMVAQQAKVPVLKFTEYTPIIPEGLTN